ncbi:hypothetical protein CRG98_043287 [Punica granatum]|uniref:Wax synthase domain-containing protein n=2 Tax=Punica granatum TaxID=22663 RepID=A0A2I0HX99_PUNGR|nr:hypothetical protein CRG98_043287 [Punica granatum]
MDQELKNLVAIWIWAFAALYYCYSAVSQIPKGTMRLLALLPIFFFLTVLPLKLSSFLLGLPTAGSLAWLCNFKLLLFAFAKGPLADSPNLLHFVSFACLPIIPRSRHGTRTPSRDAPIVPRNVLLAIKVVLLALTLKAYGYKASMHPYLVLALCCLRTYLLVEFVFAFFAALAQALLGSELDQQFNEPWFATSLQDFWGHRWNLVAASLLRSTVYLPVRNLLAPVTGHGHLNSLPAMLATFIVSGLMHELFHCYATRDRPSWEVTWFFVLHGVGVVVEVAAKKSPAGRRWSIHPAVSWPLTMAFVVMTAMWLFFPQLTRNGVDEKAMEEFYGLLSFVKESSIALITNLGKNKYI